jgi:hypothetical protein
MDELKFDLVCYTNHTAVSCGSLPSYSGGQAPNVTACLGALGWRVAECGGSYGGVRFRVARLSDVLEQEKFILYIMRLQAHINRVYSLAVE